MENKNTIEIIARAVIQKENQVLLCRVKGNEHWFFPGGHVEFGEYAEEALKRELVEEIGAEITDIQMIGVNENKFIANGKNHQEANLVYSATMGSNERIEALEEHLEFKWAETKYLVEEKIFPENLKRSILKWMEDKELFYSRQ